MTWKLQTINGEFTGAEITIEADMLVGRHQEADIVLAAAEISRRHAAFLVKEQALYVEDLRSSNGTFVNDRRIETQTLLKDGDIVQFASLKFSILAPVAAQQLSKQVELQVSGLNVEEPVVATAESTAIRQPAEAVATSELTQPIKETEPVVVAEVKTVEPAVVETAEVKVQVEKTVAEKMNDQGMPDLKQRDSTVQLSPEGMPKNVGIPKPAPIPADVDLNAPAVRHEECEVDIPPSCVEQERETQKNASIGMMALLAIILLAVIAWFVFN